MSERRPVDVALALRWRLVRDVLLDPFVWVGGVLVAVVVARTGAAFDGAWVAAAAPLVASLLALAAGLLGADALLFGAPENELLRTQPLGPRGLLEVRRQELGWWMHVPALLAAAFGLGADGAVSAVAAWTAVRLSTPAALQAALLLRSPTGGRRTLVGAATLTALGVLVLLLGPAMGAPVPSPFPATALPFLGAAPVALLGLIARPALPGTWDARYERLASAALAAPSRPRAAFGRILSRFLPLPAPLRARVARDMLLMLRGRDGRGALLLALSFLAVGMIDLDPTPTSGQLLWRALSAAALGGGAIAYAVGPGVHRLRVAVLPWVHTAPRPGPRGLIGALLWAGGLATLHGAWVLVWIGAARDGWFLADLPALAGPVLGLELAMVHFAVVFTLSRASGRTVVGEGMLIFALPVVAIVVALAGVLAPWVIPLYFVVTAGMLGEAARRVEAIEVTW